MFLFCSTQHPVPPRSEASSGDIQRAEAGAAPVGGLVTRTRATAGHYDPDDVGAAAVERRKARAPIARGTGTSRKRPSAWLAHTPKCGLSHGATSALPPPPRPAACWEGAKERGEGPCASVAEAAKRAAKRWLFDKVEKGFPVARMERRRMREQPICGSQAVESPLPDFASLHPGYRQSVT